MRARNIKPGFYKNEDLAECSLAARLAFPGLWCMADREGRLEDRPKRIKGELFAYDSIEVEPLLAELAQRGFIARYEVDGQALIQILAFSKHQNPHHREPESVLPAMPSHHGFEAEANPPKPEADAACQPGEASGSPQASPGQAAPRSDLARGASRADSLIPDSGFLIPEKEPRKRAAPIPCPEGVNAQTWADWLALRRAKKATVTQTVIDGAQREAAKAGMALDAFLRVWCLRGSQGLQADWLKPSECAMGASDRTSRQLQTAALMTGAARASTPPAKPAQETIDVEATEIRFDSVNYREGLTADGRIR